MIKLTQTAKSPCEICGTYISKGNMSRHTKRCKDQTPETRHRYGGNSKAASEIKLPTHLCPRCGKPFTNPSRHVPSCKGPKVAVPCPKYCGKEILNCNVDKHLVSCKNSAFEICVLCNAVVVNADKLEAHVSSVHANIFQPDTEQPNTVKDVSAVSKRPSDTEVSSENKKSRLFQPVKIKQVFKNKNTVNNHFTVGSVDAKAFAALKATVLELKNNVGVLNAACSFEKCDTCVKVVKKNDPTHLCDNPETN